MGLAVEGGQGHLAAAEFQLAERGVDDLPVQLEGLAGADAGDAVEQGGDGSARGEDGDIVAAGGDNIAIFTSGGTIAALLHRITGVSPSQAFELNWQIINTSLSQLKFRGSEVTLASFNSQAHVRLLRVPELVTWR